MPPRLNMFASSRTLAHRTRLPVSINSPIARLSVSRSYASDQSGKLPVSEDQEHGPNMSNSEHVSEEAAKMAQMTGGEGPDLTVGTPVQDILKEDKEAQKTAPQVLKDNLRTGQPPPKPGTRPFSTLARRQQQDMMSSNTPIPDEAVLNLSANSPASEIAPLYHKFPLPTLPIPSRNHKDYRYEPIVDQVTNLMMRDGKLGVAQRNMSVILQHLRTASAPVYNPQRPLLPGARTSPIYTHKTSDTDILFSASLPPPAKSSPIPDPRARQHRSSPAHPLPARRSRRWYGPADPRPPRSAPTQAHSLHVGARRGEQEEEQRQWKRHVGAENRRGDSRCHRGQERYLAEEDGCA